MILNRYTLLAILASLVTLVSCRKLIDMDPPYIEGATFPKYFETLSAGVDNAEVRCTASENTYLDKALFTMFPLIADPDLNRNPLTTTLEVETNHPEVARHEFVANFSLSGTVQSNLYAGYIQVVDQSGNVAVTTGGPFIVTGFGDPDMSNLYHNIDSIGYKQADSLRIAGTIFDEDTITKVMLYEYTYPPKLTLLSQQEVGEVSMEGKEIKYGWSKLTERTFLIGAMDSKGNMGLLPVFVNEN